MPNTVDWTPERVAELRGLVAEGKSAGLIARGWGVSRNAVIGKAWRLGLSVGGGETLPPPKRTAKPRNTYRTSDALRAQRSVRAKQMIAEGRFGRKLMPREVRLTAVSLYLGGYSAKQAAVIAGCSRESILRNWRKDEALVAEAKPMIDKIRAERAAAETGRIVALETERERKRLSTAAMVDHLLRKNAPVLASMSQRDSAMCRRLLEGETLEAVGSAFGVTRERVRQIVSRAIREYGLNCGVRFAGKLTR